MKPDLGSKVRDQITGLEGIVIGRTEWLTGCATLMVQPQQLKDGTPVDRVQFDETQVKVIEEKAITFPPQAMKAKPGGPRPEPRDPRL